MMYPAIVNIIAGTPKSVKLNVAFAVTSATPAVPKDTETFLTFFQKSGISAFQRSFNSKIISFILVVIFNSYT